MLLTEDCFGNLRSNSNLRRRQANTIDSSLSIQGLKTRWHLLICSTGVDTVSLKLITTLFSVRTRYAGKNSRASTVVVTLKALSKRSRWEGCCRGPVNEIQQQRLSKRVLVVAVSEFRTSKCCRGCGSVLRHPNGDDRTSYCEGKGRHSTLP